MVNNERILNIACATDDSFFYPLLVMVHSLLETNKENDLVIHLFSANLSKDKIQMVEELTGNYQQQFHFYRLDQKRFEGLPSSNRISYAAYYRIVMPEIMKENVERFLYLDADIIVNGDLSPLFSINMGNKIFGAVDDLVAIDWKMYKKHEIPAERLYFNSGVLLVDVYKWQKYQATQKVFNYLTTHPDRCKYHDQDGLNGALHDKRFKLEPIWNQQIGIYFLNRRFVYKVFNRTETLKARKRPVIIHFNGMEKPWHYESNHPYRGKYDNYCIQLGLGNFGTKKTLKKWLKRNTVYRFPGWILMNKYYYYKSRPKTDNF